MVGIPHVALIDLHKLLGDFHERRVWCGRL